MTYDGRSFEDLPLAAYGGSGMELTPEDEAKLEAPAPAVDEEPSQPADDLAGLAVDDAGHPTEDDGSPPAAFLAGIVLPPAARRVVTTLRTSRVAAGGTFVAMILVGLLLLNGGAGRPGAAAEPSASAPAAAAATAVPGQATLVLTGQVKQTLSFVGTTRARGEGSALAATWAGATTTSLGLNGPVDRGTRTTNERLVLRFTVVVDASPVTFTSTDGECTVGMAVKGGGVSGSFACKKLKSDDGKVTVGATGTYRT